MPAAQKRYCESKQSVREPSSTFPSFSPCWRCGGGGGGGGVGQEAAAAGTVVAAPRSGGESFWRRGRDASAREHAGWLDAGYAGYARYARYARYSRITDQAVGQGMEESRTQLVTIVNVVVSFDGCYSIKF
mmetsp:Transcript_13309/g.37470  ORF Transcript_13309/g.37470 Transcript_13309/m.37470 type:complete len:131 (-) Transcript_13309:24-416(-)